MQMPFDEIYRQIVVDLLSRGQYRSDRTGTGVYGLFGRTFTVWTGPFPLLTLKKTYFAGVVAELAWFLSGSTNVNDLPAKIQHWWRPFANDYGSLGPTYGERFKHLQKVIDGIRTNPTGRRHVLTLWDNNTVDQCRLPPCHGTVLQFYVENAMLHMMTHQRSCDVMLGLPVNVASYALLLQLVANQAGLMPGQLTYSLGDYHLYANHVEAAHTLLSRETACEPILNTNATTLNLKEAILSTRDSPEQHLVWQDEPPKILLYCYHPHPAIHAPMAI